MVMNQMRKNKNNFNPLIEIAMIQQKYSRLYKKFLPSFRFQKLIQKLYKKIKLSISKINNFFTKHSFLTSFIKFLFGIIIVGRITYQINSFFNSLNSPINYSISSFNAKPFDINNGKIDTPSKMSKGDNLFFKFSSTLKISSGQIKDFYIVYSTTDSPNLSLSNFHNLTPKISYNNRFKKYLFSFIPYLSNSEQIPISTVTFKSKINYQTEKTTYCYKPFYLLTIDKQNNIDIKILMVRSYSELYYSEYNIPFIMSEESFTTAPSYQLLSPSDFLKTKSVSPKFNTSAKEIQQGIKQITEISKEFYAK